MRIGIDCRTILSPAVGEKAGVGHYTYYLVQYLLKLDKRNHYVLFFDHRTTATKEFERKNTTIVRVPLSQYKRYLPFAYSHVFVARVLQQTKLDVFHSPANVLPLSYHGRFVVTVHDLAIYQHPEWFPPKQDFSIKVLVPKSVAKADAVIAVSQSTANDLHRQFKVKRDKVSVIYEGVTHLKPPTKLAVRQYVKRWKLPDRYLLYIGTLEPRKNIAGLIQAFDQLAVRHPKRYAGIQLVIAGAKGFRFQDNYQAIQQAKSGGIRYLGYVSATDKRQLLAGAEGFIFPSLYEGFGLPVLEAMAAGIPVITSSVASLPEVAGKAAILIDPNSQLSLQRAIERLVSQPALRKRLSKLGITQAAKFSWEQCAKETLEVYEKVHTSPNPS